MQLYTKILIGMVVGVVLGLAVGPNSALLPRDGAVLPSSVKVLESPGNESVAALSQGVTRVSVIEERPGDPPWLRVQWEVTAADLLRLKKAGTGGIEAVEAGTVKEGWVASTPRVRRYAPLGQSLVDWTEWIGLLFLALIKMVVVPLVFCSLLVGVASLGDFRKLGRLGLRTLLFFFATTAVALGIGLSLANLIRPGEWMSAADRALLLESYAGGAASTVGAAADAPSLGEQLIAIIPTNPLAALATGNMLQVIFFAVMFGVALTLVAPDRAKRVVDIVDTANEAMVVLVHIAMKLAPYGVAALLFKVTGTTGASVLMALGVYALVVLAGLLIHMGLTYGLTVTLGARLSFPRFLSAMKAAIMVAFSTSSSSATLPVTKESAENNLNVSPEVSSFVLPLGATVNMDGTALYQGVAAIFIAQIYSIDLSLGDQLTIVLSATMASVGAAGVPGAGMITLALVLTAIGVPTEGLALVLGVDRLLDMFRTATNVVGDSTAAVFMARLEGDDLRFLSPAADRANPNKGFEGRLDHPQHSIEPPPPADGAHDESER